jgi:protein TonB
MAFDAFLTQEKAKPKKWRRVTYTVSAAFHAALLVGGAIHSFWHVDELTPPNVQVTFMSAAPPPPPPPPAARKKTQTKVKPRPTEIVQPKPDQIVQPKEKEPEEEPDDGVEGGVEGGVAGGVVGGVVGAPPPPPPPVQQLLPPNVGKGQLAVDVQNDPRYKPGLPAQLNRAGMVIWGLFKICVSADGAVTDVKTIKAADPLVDADWIAKMRTWRYRPYSINGRPVPFCHPMRLEVRAQN